MTANMRTRMPKRDACFARAMLVLVLALGVSAATSPAEAPQGETSGKAPQGGSGLGLDTAFFKSDEPIEITADRLDVDQVNKRAVFGGNVNAVQGDVHLAGEILTVFYDQEKEGGAATAAPAAPATPAVETPPAEAAAAGTAPAGDAMGSGGRIRRMEVTGGVHVSSPTETATGDEGVYDLEAGTITLTGNVIVTRGENILRGSRLNIDVESGKSVIIGSEETGRVKGLFAPKSQTTNKPPVAAQSTSAAP
jgi:lipopolysaccharide export system protein LptA